VAITITCPDCESIVSNNISVCPTCGYDIKALVNQQNWVENKLDDFFDTDNPITLFKKSFNKWNNEDLDRSQKTKSYLDQWSTILSELKVRKIHLDKPWVLELLKNCSNDDTLDFETVIKRLNAVDARSEDAAVKLIIHTYNPDEGSTLDQYVELFLHLKPYAKNPEAENLYSKLINRFYEVGLKAKTEGQYVPAIMTFKIISPYLDSEVQINECENKEELRKEALLETYRIQINPDGPIDISRITAAIPALETIKDFKDADRLIKNYNNVLLNHQHKLTAKREKYEDEQNLKREYLAEMNQKKQLRKEKRNKFIKIFGITGTIVGVIVSVIIGAINNEQLKRVKYSQENLIFTVDSKINIETDYGTYNEIHFVMTLVNQSSLNVNYLNLEFLIQLASDDSVIWEGNVKGSVQGLGNGSSNSIDVYLTETKKHLWNYPLEAMDITISLNSARFSDYHEETFENAPKKKIHEGSIRTDEDLYQQAIILYQAGSFEDAIIIFEALGDYQNSSHYVDLCEEKLWNAAWNAALEEALYERAGEDALLPDDYVIVLSYFTNVYVYYKFNEYRSFFTKLIVPIEESNTYLANFFSKLVSNSFVLVDTNTYQKGQTIIQVTNVIEENERFMIEYYAFKIL
jgi:hypothetical protein